MCYDTLGTPHTLNTLRRNCGARRASASARAANNQGATEERKESARDRRTGEALTRTARGWAWIAFFEGQVKGWVEAHGTRLSGPNEIFARSVRVRALARGVRISGPERETRAGVRGRKVSTPAQEPEHEARARRRLAGALNGARKGDERCDAMHAGHVNCPGVFKGQVDQRWMDA